MNKEQAINEIKYAKSFGTSGIVPRWEAIDTVLNYIEKLENMYKKEYNEHMEMKRQNSVLRNNEQILKEKLEIQTENYHSAMEDINWFCANYIPKQKIRDKIEELEKNELMGKVYFEQIKFTIDILEELLGE